MGCLGRRWGLQGAATESRIHDFAIGLDFGAFAVEDTHSLSEMENFLVGVWRNKVSLSPSQTATLPSYGGVVSGMTDSMLQMQVGCLEFGRAW